MMLQDQIRAAIGRSKRPFSAVEIDESLVAAVTEKAAEKMKEAYRIARKLDRHAVLDSIREAVLKSMTSEDAGLRGPVAAALEALEKRIVRDMILGKERESTADPMRISAPSVRRWGFCPGPMVRAFLTVERPSLWRL
jgi:polyribonucleotide nucleotidyltransferase